MSLLKTMRSLQTSAHSSAALPLTEPARPKHLSPPSPRHAALQYFVVSSLEWRGYLRPRALGRRGDGGLSHMGDRVVPWREYLGEAA